MKLYIDNKILSFIYEDKIEKNIIRNFYTFKDVSKAFLRGNFDKKRIKDVCLVKSKSKTKYNFLQSGFLQSLLQLAKREKIKISELQDNRTRFDFQNEKFDIKELSKLFSFDYVEHQASALQLLLRVSYGIIQAPTSAGKTEIFIAFLKKTKISTLILVNRIDLALQTKKRMEDNGIQNIGICYGKGYIPGDIVISTIGSVGKIVDLHKFKALILDECLPGNTLVHTEKGTKTISSLVLNKSKEKIWSFNIEENKFELKTITNWFKNKINKLIVLEGDRFKIKSTFNHNIYIENFIKKRADEINIGDKIITKPRYIKGNGIAPCLSNKQYKIILGMILGDASLSKTKNLARLRFTHGEKQKEYLNFKLKLLDNMHFREKLTTSISGYNNKNKIYGSSTQSSIDFKDLYNKFYKNGIKIISEKILNDIDWSSIAFWIMDDGCLQFHDNKSINYHYEISTHSFTKKENELIIKFLKFKFNIESKLKYEKRCNKYWIYFKTVSSDIIAKNICKYIPNCMQYKLPEKYRNKFNFYIDDKKNYGLVEIKNIKEIIPKYKSVYNITVEDNHNYLIGSGLLVGNCHHVSSNSYQNFLEKTAYPIRLGFSATPDPGDNFKFAKIRQFLGEVIYKIEAKELIENKVIALPKIEFVNISCAQANDWPSSNWKCIVSNEERNRKIKDLVEEYDIKTLIIIRNIKHGKILEELINGSVFVSGIDKIDKRRSIVEEFENGSLQTVISSNIFNEGISIKSIRLLIVASGGKSKIETIQRLGRGLRTKKDKDTVNVIDFMDYGNQYTERHSVIRKNTYQKAGFSIKNR